MWKKKTKWWRELPEGFTYPIFPSMKPTYAGRGRVISGHDMVNRLEVDLEKTKIFAVYNGI